MSHGITFSAMNVQDRLIDLTLGKRPYHARTLRLRIEPRFKCRGIFHLDHFRGFKCVTHIIRHDDFWQTQPQQGEGDGLLQEVRPLCIDGAITLLLLLKEVGYRFIESNEQLKVRVAGCHYPIRPLSQ